MANFTDNYRLKKPKGTDKFDIEDFNQNADTIDYHLSRIVEDKISGTPKTIKDTFKTRITGTNDYEILNNIINPKNARVQQISGISLKQIVTNGNFSNGGSNWKIIEFYPVEREYTPQQVVNGMLIFTPANQTDSLVQYLNINANSRYYVSITISAEEPMNVAYGFQSYSGNTTFNQISIDTKKRTFTKVLTPQQMYNWFFIGMPTSTGKSIYINEIRIYDLTNTNTEITDLVKFHSVIGGLPYFQGIWNSKPTELVSSGSNWFDEIMEVGTIVNGIHLNSTTRLRSKNYMEVFPGIALKTISTTQHTLVFYDYSKNYLSDITIGSGEFIIPDKCYYLKLVLSESYGISYMRDIAIYLADNPEIIYEPYKPDVMAITTQFLWGMPKLRNGVGDRIIRVGNNYFYENYVGRRVNDGVYNDNDIYDDNYIYYQLTTPQILHLQIDETYIASNYGFEKLNSPAYMEVIYPLDIITQVAVNTDEIKQQGETVRKMRVDIDKIKDEGVGNVILISEENPGVKPADTLWFRIMSEEE